MDEKRVRQLYDDGRFMLMNVTYSEFKKQISRLGFEDDRLFKFTLGSNDEKSNKILKKFIESFLHITIDEIIPMNKEMIQSFMGASKSVDVFVRCHDTEGKFRNINFEMHNYGDMDLIVTKSQLYSAYTIVSNVPEGWDGKTDIIENYQLFICGKVKLFDDNDYYREYHLYDEVHKHRIEKELGKIAYVELGKLNILTNKPVSEWSDFEKLLFMLKYGYDEKYHDIIELLKKDMEELSMMDEKRDKYLLNQGEALESLRIMFDNIATQLELEKISKGKEEVAKGKEEIAKGKEEIAKGKEEVAKGKEEVAKGNEELSRGNEELAKRKEELSKEKAKFAQEKEGFEAIKIEFVNDKIELENDKIELENAKRKLIEMVMKINGVSEEEAIQLLKE